MPFPRRIARSNQAALCPDGPDGPYTARPSNYFSSVENYTGPVWLGAGSAPFQPPTPGAPSSTGFRGCIRVSSSSGSAVDVRDNIKRRRFRRFSDGYHRFPRAPPIPREYRRLGNPSAVDSYGPTRENRDSASMETSGRADGVSDFFRPLSTRGFRAANLAAASCEISRRRLLYSHIFQHELGNSWMWSLEGGCINFLSKGLSIQEVP